MANGPLAMVVRRLRRLVNSREAGEATDSDLLDRFRNRQEESAYEALIQRYGPMVFAGCMRMLHQHQDAEDAFQTTFLVLARKAGSIGQSESLGSWLYSVAYRTALKSRKAQARRHEEPMLDRAGPAMDSRLAQHGLSARLDEELN